MTITDASSKVELYKQKFKLQEHPEGGFYARTFASKATLPSSTNHHEPRHCSSAIYFLLQGQDFSGFHKIDAQEMWHYYDGNTELIVHVFDPNTKQYEKIILGRDHPDAVFQQVVQPECWFAAELVSKSEDSFVLVGCTVTPEFQFSKFELAKHRELSSLFPEYRELIDRLCRE
jgi:predicted cupin superfamily sugar epimerase